MGNLLFKKKDKFTWMRSEGGRVVDSDDGLCVCVQECGKIIVGCKL